ncbi:protoporphyrinogen/coproporphyrinogen oxidase [Microbacterium gorillae]|uniref:protoporphyrinogen/coproporphyrinogen oxidase n=1 Tax=Microbacterium gorillae TaxID=1231063 RepID=UPI003D998E8C
MLSDTAQRSALSDPSAEGSGAVVVIGGGIAGMVSAWELARSGARVVLLEAGDELGGRVRRENIDDVTLDIGAESFATRGGAVAALLTELGMADEIVHPASLGSWVVTSDAARAVPLPPAGTIGIPATPLSWSTVRALGVAGAMRAAIEPLLPPSIGRSGALDDVIRARLGARVLDRLVRPVVLGIHSTDPADMTVRSIPGLAEAYARRGSLILAARDLRASRTAAGGAVAGLRGGMASLVSRLREELDLLGVAVHTGTRVIAVRRDAEGPGGVIEPGSATSDPEGGPLRLASLAQEPGGGLASRLLSEPLGETKCPQEPGLWRILTEDAELRADAVVLAVPEHIAAPLLGRANATPAEVEVVALLIDDARLDAAPRGTGVLIAESAGASVITAKALTHVTAKWPERATGPHVLRLSYGRLGRAPETLGLDDAMTTALALADASRILDIALAPSSVRGMRRRVWTNVSGSPDTTADALPPGLALAGDWVSGTGLASVIPGARRAAADTLAALHRSVSGSTQTGEVRPQHE